ncbi:hypothetical protein H6F77_13655 [Microcoleus sp. FACHB-831]|uniref:hypothetical protein n=1 Tax=Microcoleus sp. FACHB-831 TaxID=2692827 RepID=UPI001681FEAA|nr:hypothetical protein [Microcoleus sp. FACHB-831]MBD1922127.1 hypothetical protein [Microcoleus sp. FACHB-831]
MGSSNKGSRKSKPRYTSFEIHGVSAEVQKAFWSTVAGVVLVVQGGVILLNPQLATLECDRLQRLGMCKLVLSSLQGETVTPFPLDGLKKAEVETKGKSNQLVLLTADGKLYFPINISFSSTGGKASEINAFVQDSNIKSLKIEQDNRWFAYPIAVITILLGCLALSFNLKVLLNSFVSRPNL